MMKPTTFIYSMFILLLLAFQNASSAAEITPTCTTERLDELKLSAQSRDPRTSELAQSLKDCPSFRDEALVWGAIYESSLDRYDQMGSYITQVQQPSETATRMTILSEAANGSYQTLESLIKSGKSGWNDDAEANFVLARAAIRARNVVVAKKAYERYLELKPDDIDMQIESIYALMVDFPHFAKAQLNKLAKNDHLTEAQKTAVNRSTVFLAQTFAPHYLQTTTERTYLIPAKYEQFNDTIRGFMRQSLKTGYYSANFEVDLTSSNLSSNNSNTHQIANDATIKKAFKTTDQLSQVMLSGGWFGGRTKNIFIGSVELSHSSEFGLIGILGVQKEPWAKYSPIAFENSDWDRTSQTLELRYFDYLSLRGAKRTVSEQSTSQQILFNAKVPIWRAYRGYQIVSLLLTQEQLSSDRYSPFVYSPKAATTRTMGLHYEYRWNSTSTLLARYLMGEVDLRLHLEAPGASLTNTSAKGKTTSGSIEWSYIFNNNWSSSLSLSGSKVKDSAGNRIYESRLYSIGLAWGGETL